MSLKNRFRSRTRVATFGFQSALYMKNRLRSRTTVTSFKFQSALSLKNRLCSRTRVTTFRFQSAYFWLHAFYRYASQHFCRVRSASRSKFQKLFKTKDPYGSTVKCTQCTRPRLRWLHDWMLPKQNRFGPEDLWGHRRLGASMTGWCQNRTVLVLKTYGAIKGMVAP